MFVSEPNITGAVFSVSLFTCDTARHTHVGEHGEEGCVERAGAVCHDYYCKHSSAGKLFKASLCFSVHPCC